MANFNKRVSKAPNATSYEGGAMYSKDPVEDWMNFLFSSYLEDRYYESASKQTERFLGLLDQVYDKCGAEFVAKTAVFARNELGMRSVAQLTAAWLNAHKFDRKRNFYRNFCHRPDDVAEIFAAIDFLEGKRSHALVRGCGDYLSKLTEYQLGKYKMNSHGYNMYDCINITHAHSSAIDDYKAGNLSAPDTWEVAISAADSKEARDEEWKRLVEENKLGYMALLRNLRNILSAEGVDRRWIEDVLVPCIKDTAAIRRSKIFPYQIYSAYRYMDNSNPGVVAALEFAFTKALSNMPTLDGTTLVMMDVSGSMDSAISRNSKITIKEAGAVYALCLALTGHVDYIKFGSTAAPYNMNLNNNVFDNIAWMAANSGLGYGTSVSAAFNEVKKHYDRIVLISDMQTMAPGRGWWGEPSGVSCYKDYCRKFGVSPIYSFDLGNYPTQTDNPDNPNVHLCTSLSEKTLKFMSLLESGESIVDYINANYNY